MLHDIAREGQGGDGLHGPATLLTPSPAHNPPCLVAPQVLSEIVREGKVGIAATERMDQNLTQFEDVLGGCERILKTPIPLSYTR